MILTFKTLTDVKISKLTKTVVVQILNSSRQPLRNNIASKSEDDDYNLKGEEAYDTTFQDETMETGELSFFNIEFLSTKERAKYGFLESIKMQL